jgi:CHRD domain-containing protein
MIRRSGSWHAAQLSFILFSGLWAQAAAAEEVHVFPLDGAQAVPPSRSKATASAIVILKGRTGKLRIHWQDLSGRPTRFDIRGPAAAGEAGPLLVTLTAPRGRAARSDSAVVDFAVAQSRKKIFRDQKAYLTVRTARYPAGEIRGQIIPTDEENDEDD